MFGNTNKWVYKVYNIYKVHKVTGVPPGRISRLPRRSRIGHPTRGHYFMNLINFKNFILVFLFPFSPYQYKQRKEKKQRRQYPLQNRLQSGSRFHPKVQLVIDRGRAGSVDRQFPVREQLYAVRMKAEEKATCYLTSFQSH